MMDDPTLDFISLAKDAFDAFEQARVNHEPEWTEVVPWSELSIWERDAWIDVVKSVLQGSVNGE